MSENIQKKYIIEIDVIKSPTPNFTIEPRRFWKTRHPKVSNASPESFTQAIKKQTDLITRI
jgi:hypothetical protein